MNKTQTQKGITLVALIITVIVMLILVAVTLVITLGENGIIAKAREAKEKQSNRTELENLAFSSEDAEGKIDDVVGGGTWNIDTGKEAGVDFPNFGKQYVEIREGYHGEDNYTLYTYIVFNADGTGIRLRLVDDGTGKRLDPDRR